MKGIKVQVAVQRTAADGQISRFTGYNKAGKSVGASARDIRRACANKNQFLGYWWSDSPERPQEAGVEVGPSSRIPVRLADLVVGDSVLVCMAHDGQLMTGLVAGDPPTPAAYVASVAPTDDDDIVHDGVIRTSDFFLNASRFCDDHGTVLASAARVVQTHDPDADRFAPLPAGRDFFTWFASDAAIELLRSLAANAPDSMDWLLMACGLVTKGPPRLRGVWVPEAVGRALAESTSPEAGGRLDGLYKCLRQEPAIIAQLPPPFPPRRAPPSAAAGPTGTPSAPSPPRSSR
ncbi:hypothetical protein WJX74_002830 [Apatococcus lobatus]|uniref:Uncharacterized protein n=1 Tax=Apatococcus lobatus TaxID=904363 RepID=A0AAW1SFN0_9CHLO